MERCISNHKFNKLISLEDIEKNPSLSDRIKIHEMVGDVKNYLFMECEECHFISIKIKEFKTEDGTVITGWTEKPKLEDIVKLPEDIIKLFYNKPVDI